MAKPLHIMFYCLNAGGHLNPCIGVAEILRDRGHRITFVVNQTAGGKLQKLGFDELVADFAHTEASDDSNKYIKKVADGGFFNDATPLEKLKISPNLPVMKAAPADPLVEAIIDRIKPHLIFVSFLILPSIVKSGVPWINLCPANPISYIYDAKTQPPLLGLPSYDQSSWSEMRREWKQIHEIILEEDRRLFTSKGLQPCRSLSFFLHSPYLNIYAFPEELDYLDMRPLPDKWHRVDTFIRSEKDEDDFELPDNLKNTPGKLIYFSLGSMGSINVPLMKKLTGFMENIGHRFIVSKGIFADQFDLPDNCWGQASVPQTKILPLVDAVVMHGGNNSVSESMVAGKPMVVMPLFVDQFDNAQRIDELGFGVRMDPFKCTREELAQAIDKLVHDDRLNAKLKVISARINNDLEPNRKRLAKLIEDLVG